MTDLCAIQGQLVDVRNVGTHKCVKLTIHVPAEYAMQVLQAFGWATGVDPVPVAVARLNNGKEAMQTESPKPDATLSTPAAPEADNAKVRPVRRDWHELSPAQQAGIRCNEPAFVKFLQLEYRSSIVSTADAGSFVREWCEVESRRDIRDGAPLAQWQRLETTYRAWQLAPAAGAA